MATFSDLLLAAQPALTPGGATATVTEGTSWKFTFATLGVDKTPIDLTGITGTCKVYEGTTNLLNFQVTGDLGTLTIYAPSALTADLAAGAPKSGRKAHWDFKITDGTDTVQVWSGHNSVLVILPDS